jgi:3,4-dihydroxy 2-butanone 4-phosphate synthase/GTP cyclohydrolase II
MDHRGRHETGDGSPGRHDRHEGERMSFIEVISPIEDVIEEARNGRMFILVDDEDRENEGDLVIPAQMATPAVINFMAKHGRGLICLTLTRERVEQLKLPLMPQQNASRLRTAFTVSIEAREGVTTGISAPDRARTVATAIDPSKGPGDIETPGHIFPLMARDGGVLVRTGHTEAAVDIARLAGLNPSGVICEIMNDDGTMARREDLVRFAQFHGMKIATIADLIAYRRRHDRIVERRLETSFESKYGGHFQMYIYVNTVAHVEHIALVKGDISTPEPVPVRMHALNVLDDVLGSSASGRGGVLQSAMAMIAEIGRGVVVLLREPLPTSLLDRMRGLAEKTESPVPELRDYGVGAQILFDLGVRDMILLSNTHRTIVGLEGYGLTVVGERPITPSAG